MIRFLLEIKFSDGLGSSPNPFYSSWSIAESTNNPVSHCAFERPSWRPWMRRSGSPASVGRSLLHGCQRISVTEFLWLFLHVLKNWCENLSFCLLGFLFVVFWFSFIPCVWCFVGSLCPMLLDISFTEIHIIYLSQPHI